MPRRKIHNELDAAELLADCSVKLAQGKMNANDIYALVNSLTAFGNLRKQYRDARDKRKAQARADEAEKRIHDILFDSPGAEAFVQRNMLPPRKRY